MIANEYDRVEVVKALLVHPTLDVNQQTEVRKLQGIQLRCSADLADNTTLTFVSTADRSDGADESSS